MDNQMTLEQIDAELSRREALASSTETALATGDLLSVGLALFQANPERILTESASFARLMELDAARRTAAPVLDKALSDMNSDELRIELFRRAEAYDGKLAMQAAARAIMPFVPESRRADAVAAVEKLF